MPTLDCTDIARTFALAGWPDAPVDAVYTLEETLAAVSLSEDDRRDPNLLYNKIGAAACLSPILTTITCTSTCA
jgi:hypothetical protein